MRSEDALRPCEAGSSVVLLGIPLDHNSSHLRGPRLAPHAIRRFLRAGSMNWSSEEGVDLESDSRWGDAGDVLIEGGPGDMARIAAVAGDYWGRGQRILALGGDHSITAPLLRGARAARRSITIVHFDAHPDLYPEFEGNRDSHASPFYRIMEERLAQRLIQIGIRTLNAEQRTAVERFQVQIVSPDELYHWAGLTQETPVYISIDMDVLDPAFAPGVSHHEPGGLTVRDVLRALARIRAPLIGGDIVETNPERDPTTQTTAVAAKFLKELLAALLHRPLHAP